MEPEKDIFEQWTEKLEARPWITRKLNHISGWWNYEAQYYLKDFTTGIKNLWYWLPVIWKDRNWDHQFIFDILSHKLKAQSKCIGGRGIHVSAERDAEIMMTCVRLIEKVSSEWYSMEYMDYHKTKHWFEPADKEGYSTWESKQIGENFDDYFAKYPLIYKRVLNGEGIFKLEGTDDDKQRIAMNIAHINHDRARKLLFKIMEQEIERWWD
jgi:hypothetical protein